MITPRLDALRDIQTANLTATVVAELEFDSVNPPPDTGQRGKQMSSHVKHDGKA